MVYLLSYIDASKTMLTQESIHMFHLTTNIDLLSIRVTVRVKINTIFQENIFQDCCSA